jgi:hypothetical protein
MVEIETFAVGVAARFESESLRTTIRRNGSRAPRHGHGTSTLLNGSPPTAEGVDGSTCCSHGTPRISASYSAGGTSEGPGPCCLRCLASLRSACRTNSCVTSPESSMKRVWGLFGLSRRLWILRTVIVHVLRLPLPLCGNTSPFLAATHTWMLIGRIARRRHIVRAVMYGIQVFYSYLLMLVAMTYQVNTARFHGN